MPDDYATLLNPEKARIFRIIHRANLSWVLDHGLHCGNSAVRAAQWVSISNILILVASLPRVAELGLRFLFTDSHANNSLAKYYNALADVGKVDWKLLQARDFKRDPDDPAKFGRYQAEALVHQHYPVQGLSGVVCYTESVKMVVEKALAVRGLHLQVVARTGWYF